MRCSGIFATAVLSRKSRPKLYFEHLALGHALLDLELVGYRAPNEFRDRFDTPLWMLPDLSGNHFPHILVDLDRDTVILVGFSLVFPSQGCTPLQVLNDDNGISEVLGEAGCLMGMRELSSFPFWKRSSKVFVSRM